MSTTETPDLAPGDVVSGLESDELVEIEAVEPFGQDGQRVLLVGFTVESQRRVRRPLKLEELALLERVGGAKPTFDGNAGAFLLGAEAERLRIAHQFDPLFAVSSSVVDPLPHQIEAVYRYLLPLPRIRFLLADDTGAGKTIMTGLLLKELLFRGLIHKILIVTPGGLTRQWVDELDQKFGLPSKLVNRASFDSEPAQFGRTEDATFVVSVDFLSRNEGCLNAAEQTMWDFIVVDEAHKLSAYEYGSKLDESLRYQALKTLAPRTEHLLFLTATPHRGRKDTFRRLLMLLDEDLFRKDELVTERVQQQIQGQLQPDGELRRARNRFFLRRLKEEMVDWDGSPLFKPRHTKTVGYDLTPEEKDLYEAVTQYVRAGRRQAKAQKNRNVELILMVMQRRLASSLHAITRTLEKRLERLEEVLRILRDPELTEAMRKRLEQDRRLPEDPRDIFEYEELSEDEREAVDDRIFHQVLTADPAKVEAERDQVRGLFERAHGLRHHREAKFVELLNVLDQSDVMRSDDEKLVLFTEHRDTLDSLANRLEEQGYTVVTIHGGMDVDARQQAQREFYGPAQILVATDAAGEGINLQFCRFLINWDIPWNPNRLEQRMGRIHRYGQPDDVWVYNLVARDTREGAVLERVLTKLDVMREQMGEDRVYDVIDDLLEGVPLVKLLERAIDEEQAPEEETDRLLETATRERAETLIHRQSDQAVASTLDLSYAVEQRDASDERRLQPLFIERFFRTAWAASGGSLQRDKQLPIWHLGDTPSALVETARRARQTLRDCYTSPFVFDKQVLSPASGLRVPEGTGLLGPGHPLFDALLEWALRQARPAFAKGSLLIDPNLSRPQRIWLVRSVVKDARRDRGPAGERLELVAMDHMGLRVTSPAYLLDCLAPEESMPLPDAPAEPREQIQAWAWENVTERQMARLTTSREQECDLRREYLESAFTDVIMELQEQIAELDQASLFGKGDPEEQARLRERVEAMKERKAMRLEELDQMTRLQADLPEVLTEALVAPSPVAVLEPDQTDTSRGFPMRRDDEVEAIAMEVTMRFERARGWNPEDVHEDGYHYDIRSVSPGGEKRFIEVKGRAQTGPVVITQAELDRLRQLGERAWLYVVTFCKSAPPAEASAKAEPRLRIIQDPANRLTPEMLYRQVQYLVDEGDWASQGEEVPVPPENQA